ncbi:MAG: UvrD-helicase domain-containing protein [Methylomicrobium sp.]|nr:UvrD-helicase domain-containing protein [Methylomicrobium sp.]
MSDLTTLCRRSNSSLAFTEEQRYAIDLAKSGYDLKINAFAGTGKTSTLLGIAEAMADKRGLYVAFNNANADDAVRRFPSHVECRTAHSLAYRALGFIYQDQLKMRLTGTKTAELLAIRGKVAGLTHAVIGYLVLDTVQRYAQSTDQNIESKHVPTDQLGKLDSLIDRVAVKTEVVQYANKLWRMKLSGNKQTPVSHDDYLKLWSLAQPPLDVDFILFDEAQDSNPVMLELIARQNAQHIYVGDRYQQIYAWRGAVNAMKHIQTEREASLRQSFRFGPAVADVANQILGLDGINGLKGLSNIESVIRPDAEPNAVICRSNSGAVSALIKQMAAKRKACLPKGAAEMANLLDDALRLRNGQTANSPELALFNNWAEVVEHAETLQGASLKPLITLVNDYKTSLPLLKELIWQASKQKPEFSDVVISTTHGAKGREWNSVQVYSDFSRPIDPIKSKRNGI